MVIRALQFRDPVFKGCFTLFVGPWEDVVAYLRERDFTTDDISAPKAAKTLSLESTGAHEVLLWFPDGWTLATPDGIALLAHEALHAVHFQLKTRGVEASSLLDEVGNYYLEWLVREIACQWMPEAQTRSSRANQSSLSA
jgi:hypothetical protein